MLKNKTIIVTGGVGLLGKVFIDGILENGGNAIIADINTTLGEQLQRELQLKYGEKKVSFLEINICSKSSINQLIENVVRKYGKIDGWVNNAYPRNKNYGNKFFEVEYSDFCENLSLNLGGYFLASQQIAAFFEKQGYGNIINISSVYGIIAPRFEIYEGTSMTMPVEYAVIKSGLLHLTKYMAKQFKRKNIRVNAISPGGIFDNQPKEFIDKYNNFCMGKGMLDRQDVIGALIFLLSDSSKHINGQNIIIDDGFTL